MNEQALTELRNDIKSILEQLTQLRVGLAMNYVTKDEFNEYKRQEASNKWKLAAFCVSAGGFTFGVIQWVVELVR